VDCRNEAVNRFNLWMLDPQDKTIIHPDLRETVYCYGLKNATERSRWDFLFEQYQLEEVDSERVFMRGGLTCTDDQQILQQLFDEAVDAESTSIRANDKTAISTSIARNPLTTEYVWQRLDQDWDNILSRTSVLSAVVETYSTPDRLEQLDQFYEDHPPIPAESATYDSIRYDLEANIRWRNRNWDDLLAWLDQVLAPTRE